MYAAPSRFTISRQRSAILASSLDRGDRCSSSEACATDARRASPSVRRREAPRSPLRSRTHSSGGAMRDLTFVVPLLVLAFALSGPLVTVAQMRRPRPRPSQRRNRPNPQQDLGALSSPMTASAPSTTARSPTAPLRPPATGSSSRSVLATRSTSSCAVAAAAGHLPPRLHGTNPEIYHAWLIISCGAAPSWSIPIGSRGTPARPTTRRPLLIR